MGSICSLNTNNGYAASGVDIYIHDRKHICDLWLFLNSTLFWLIREASGRKSLGGGMLKSEAVDLKGFPIYFDFKAPDEIENLIQETSTIKVLNANEEIFTNHHKKIDQLVFKKLQISDDLQDYVVQKFLSMYNERVNKSKT